MEYNQFDFTEVLEENINTCTGKIYGYLDGNIINIMSIFILGFLYRGSKGLVVNNMERRK